jgi:hypothetical protein
MMPSLHTIATVVVPVLACFSSLIENPPENALFFLESIELMMYLKIMEKEKRRNEFTSCP